MRARGFNGYFPFVAGDIPVQLVVILEEPQRVQDAVTQNHRARGIFGVGHGDLEPEVTALAGLFVLERSGVIIGDGERLEEKRIVEALRRFVFDGNDAKDSVVGANESNVYDFSDFDGAVGIDGYLLVEILYAVLARGYRKSEGKRAGKKRYQREQPNDSGAAGPRHAANHVCAAPPKLTLGTSRSAGALISKNSRGLKLNMPAMMFEGNTAILVLRSRTTAL